jgi:putative oxidoreductase
MLKTISYISSCALLILLFSYTAISKGLHMDTTLYEMRNQPFPRVINDILSYLIPTMELLIVVMLLKEKTRLLGLYIAAVLMSLFTIYVIIILVGVFKRVPCSCGGIISSLGWNQHLWLNLFFLFISIIGIRYHKDIHA